MVMKMPGKYKQITTFLLIVAMAALTACSDRKKADDGDNGNGSAGDAQVQVVNVSPDSPVLDVLINGSRLSRLPFTEATERSTINAGSGVLLVTADTPDGIENALGPTALGLKSDVKTTLLLIDDYLLLRTLQVESANTAVPAGRVRGQIANTAPGAGALDIYITLPGAPITGSTPVASLNFGEAGNVVDLDPRTVEFQITERGDTNVIYNSGPFSLAAGEDLLFAVVDEPTSIASAVSLLVLEDTGSTEILSADAEADFRATHASPVTGPLDVRATPLLGLPTTEFTDLARGDVSQFTQLPPDDYLVDFLFAGTVITAVSGNVSMFAGEQYTVYAANIPGELDFFATDDDRRPIATEARLQVVHLAATLGVGPVDVYVLPAGEAIAFAEPFLEDLVYRDLRTDYRALAADNYELAVTAADSDLELGPRLNLGALVNGVIYAVVLRDNGFGVLEFTTMDGLQ